MTAEDGASPPGLRVSLRRVVLWCGALTVLLLAVLTLATALGAGHVPLGAVLRALLGESGSLDPAQAAILLKVRLPRVLLAAILGGSLTTAGVVFQALLRNPLADPYVLGVSGGASIGGVLALFLGLGGSAFVGGAMLGAEGGLLATVLGVLASFAVPLCAFLGALLALVLIEWVASVDGRPTVYTILLTGAVFNAFSGAFIYFLQSIASLEELHAIVFYLMGSIPPLGYPLVLGLGAVALASTLALFAMARDYNTLSLGEEGASQLGVDVERVRRRTFFLGSVLTGLSVAVAGLIGFVGLVVPHLLRLVLGPDHRLLIPAGFLGGAAFLVLADLLARLIIAPGEIPVGVVTALAGGPFFLYLMRRRGGRDVVL